MGKFGKGLIESMQQAARYAAGTKVRGLRVSKIELPDVKSVSTSPSLRAKRSNPSRKAK